VTRTLVGLRPCRPGLIFSGTIRLLVSRYGHLSPPLSESEQLDNINPAAFLPVKDLVEDV
jgi:hypothetical protein